MCRFETLFFLFLFIHAFHGYVAEFCNSACGLVAIIPARGGSKGLPNKNLAIIANETLVARTINIINASKAFESIWVSTDVKTIADEAELAGAKVHWRAPETATDTASTLSVVQDFLKYHPGVRALATVQCTSPFLCPQWLKKASLLFDDANIDCVFSVTRSYKLRWKQNKDGFAVPANFDPKHRPRRQDWDGELFETGMFYFSRRKLIEGEVLQNDKCKMIEVPMNRSLEIDTALDLKIAELFLPLLGNCDEET